MDKNKLILITIFILAVFLRFFQLEVNPPSLTWDEASWGINAYSISTSGKDEFGRFLPITYLESFGDFKPPVYAYLTVIPIWIFGLSEFSVRFMSAFLGCVAVILTYFLTKELFQTSQKKETIALFASFLLAISPWHILLSRAAFEANVATFFIILGVIFFLISTRKTLNPFLLTPALLSFVLAMYTFNTSRIFLPIFVLVLVLIKRKILISHWKKTALSMLIPFLISVPLLLFMLTPQAQLRYQEVNIFSDISVIERTNQEMENSGSSLVSRFVHNRRLAYAASYINHYLDNLNPKFLFITGDGNPKFSIQDVGQMYLWELPFLVIGIFMVFRRKEGYSIILPLWIIFGIIPAATARETPHALRIETTLPAFQIITAYGLFLSINFLRDKIKNIYLAKGIWIGLTISMLVFFLYFFHNYFTHYPIKYASEWQYGYKEAIEFTESQKNNYEKIYFTQDLGRPYAYIMFYGRYPTDILQTDANIRREALGFVHVDRLGKYYFPKVMPEDPIKSLFVGVSGKIPPGVNIVKKVYLPDGKESLVIYEK